MKTYKIKIYWPYDMTETYSIEGELFLNEGHYCIQDKYGKSHYYPIMFTKIDEQ